MRCLSFYFIFLKKNQFHLFFLFSPFSSSSSSPSTPSIRVLHYHFWLLWTTGNTLLLLVTAKMCDTHLFCNPFLKEALIHGAASCHPDSMSPTWCASSQASSSLYLLLLLKQLLNDKRMCLAVQKQDGSLADQKDSVSLQFPAKHLKDHGEEKMAETSGETRTTTSDCCNCSWELWHPRQTLKHTICTKYVTAACSALTSLLLSQQ